jgi:hypothetical protein
MRLIVVRAVKHLGQPFRNLCVESRWLWGLYGRDVTKVLFEHLLPKHLRGCGQHEVSVAADRRVDGDGLLMEC